MKSSDEGREGWMDGWLDDWIDELIDIFPYSPPHHRIPVITFS
jgi:hypothetical protein